MSNLMKSIGVILARGASKRLPRKNVRLLAGYPLVAWSCHAALSSGLDCVVLSTEDEEIADIGRQVGVDVPFRRPAELAEDYAQDIDIILHAVDTCETHYSERFDNVVLIQATTPFVERAHIDACIERLNTEKLNCVFTARKAVEHPRWMWVVNKQDTAEPFMGSVPVADEQHHQNLSTVFYPSGAAWAARIEEVRNQGTIYCGPLGIVEMPWERSVDIDTELDWVQAETIAADRGFLPAGIRK
jgi:CMP-N-acetylneuraminic acid synthetase